MCGASEGTFRGWRGRGGGRWCGNAQAWSGRCRCFMGRTGHGRAWNALLWQWGMEVGSVHGLEPAGVPCAVVPGLFCSLSLAPRLSGGPCSAQTWPPASCVARGREGSSLAGTALSHSPSWDPAGNSTRPAAVISCFLPACDAGGSQRVPTGTGPGCCRPPVRPKATSVALWTPTPGMWPRLGVRALSLSHPVLGGHV